MRCLLAVCGTSALPCPSIFKRLTSFFLVSVCHICLLHHVELFVPLSLGASLLVKKRKRICVPAPLLTHRLLHCSPPVPVPLAVLQAPDGGIGEKRGVHQGVGEVGGEVVRENCSKEQSYPAADEADKRVCACACAFRTACFSCFIVIQCMCRKTQNNNFKKQCIKCVMP